MVSLPTASCLLPLVCLLMVCLPLAAAAAEPDVAAQVAAMDRIAWLAGRWEGTPTTGVNTWQHVAVVWDGANVVHYVNGQPYDTRALQGQLTDPSSGLGLGCRSVPANGTSSTNLNSFFEGILDEVAIYKRALSSSRRPGREHESERKENHCDRFASKPVGQEAEARIADDCCEVVRKAGVAHPLPGRQAGRGRRGSDIGWHPG